MKCRQFFFLTGFFLLSLVVSPGVSDAGMRHEVFLPKTEHELNVYRISGEEPGKTLMIVGGIQGDEPGGYMTADLYADINLKKGNLIVVPRANFYSILLNRRNGRTGDMNRKFASQDEPGNLESEVVNILKHLIAESDCLINLHEGSGFYAPEWISEMEGPMRFGQSIIYDTEVYKIPDTGQAIFLGELVRRVVDRVNPQISERRYWFKSNNHDTFSPDSVHKEQRKSATFYALTHAHIPAFGVETSKSIQSLEVKIRLEKLVINAFMDELGIVVDTPGVNVTQPRLAYLLLKVNDGFPLALPSGSQLTINPGDDIEVTDIIANYQRGLVADIEGLGTKNDNNIPYRVADSTRVLVRKDSQLCGWVDLKTSPLSGQPGDEHPAAPIKVQAEQLLVNVGGEIKTVTEGRTLKVREGAWLILQEVRTNVPGLDKDVKVNFKGFAPPKAVNDGNDLHFPIYTGRDLWVRYSEDRKGRRYPLVVIYRDRIIGRFWVELVAG